jgi:hypothetical protein
LFVAENWKLEVVGQQEEGEEKGRKQKEFRPW